MSYEAQVAGWHDFYIVAGTASATLVGLLFVGLSLHLQIVVSALEVRSLARVTPAPRSAVIVGTGLAGGNAAVTLREDGWPGRIVMLGNEPGVPFGRPPLSKTYLRGEESLEGWLVKPEAWYAAHGVELRTGVT